MFSKDKNQAIGGEKGNDLGNRLSQDFIVHNMPSPLSSSALTNKTSSPSSGNHKKTGLIIISLGVLLVAGLVYGAYVLVIKPSLSPKTVQEKTTSEINSGLNTEGDELQTNLNVPAPETNSSSVAVIETPPATSTVIVDVATSTIISESMTDTDGDGLSDAEELLLGSNPENIDSDGDGNADLIELQNSYNPAGVGRLASSSNLVVYRNSSLKYSLLQPKSWVLKNLNGNETVLVSSEDENYFIQVIHQTNPENLAILDWYQAEFPDQAPGEAKSAADGSWQGVYNNDKTVFYLSDQAKKNIYVFSLGAVEGNTANYFRLFEMIIDNFKLNVK